MDSEKNLDQNPNPYDDDHDSDLEARLYAEVHFSNNIIGEESNSTTSNQTANVMGSDSNKVDNSKLGENLRNQSKQTENSNANNVSSSSIGTPVSKRIQNEGATNTISGTPQKRSIENNSNELNKSSKKRRSEPGPSGQLKKNDTNAHVSPTDRNKVINPCNKNVDNRMIGLPLLSPELLNILFKRPVQVNLNKQSKKINQNSKENIKKNKLKKKVPQQSKAQINLPTAMIENHPISVVPSTDRRTSQNCLEESSQIIDISSEDSSEDNSKYSTTVATDKKLCKKKAVLAESEESTSDSEESIYEVPVPPKPAPPVIDLKDSGSEFDDSDSESENTSLFDDSSISQKHMTEREGDKSLNSTIASTDNEHNNDSIINESDDVILNCTEIQKGVSSLSEIKEMRQQSNQSSLSTKNDTQNFEVQQHGSHSDNMCRTGNSSIEQNQLNNSASNDKVKNNSNKKQSNSQPNSKQISNEEYFFQPMNDKMKAFYNDSWGGENFDMDKLKSKMSSDPNKWAILNTDIVASFVKRKRYFGMVCSRCHKDGHRQNQCTEITKSPTCHMCGETGHIEISCPKKMCLTCGKKQNMYRKTCENCRKMLCTRCQSYGHLSYSCPDLWRRYHQTINKVNAEPPDNLRHVIKSRNELQCCNCTKRGHVSAVCDKLRWSQHFPNPEHVTNYNGPAYVPDCEPPRISNNTNKTSFNTSSTHDSSLNISSTVSGSINLKSAHETLLQNQNLITSPAKTIRESRNPLILEVKQKTFTEGIVLKTKIVELNLRKRNIEINNESWIYLEKFLNLLACATPAQFQILKCGEKIKISMKCQKRMSNHITKLIKAYALRNSIERPRMWLSCDTQIQKFVSHLYIKLNELNKLNEDPLKLCEEWKQLDFELKNKKNPVLDDLDYSSKVRKLVLCRRNLLMILYREGFLDDSLKKLRQFHTKLTTGKKYKKKSSRKIFQPVDLIKYLNLFNNVFSPHEHPQLDAAICKFQEHLERCNRLRNNPLLFPQSHNQLNQNLSSNNKSSASGTPLTSPIPSLLSIHHPKLGSSQSTPSRLQDLQKGVQETSHIPPLLPNFTAENSPSTSNRLQNCQKTVQETIHSIPPLLSNHHSKAGNFQSTPNRLQDLQKGVQETSHIPSLLPNYNSTEENSPSTSNRLQGCQKTVQETKHNKTAEQLQYLKRHPRGLFLESVKDNKKESNSKLTKKLSKFQEETKNLINTAKKLNLPHLHKHIDILQKKMQNEIYVYEKDVKLLRQHVNEELRRHGEKWKK